MTLKEKIEKVKELQKLTGKSPKECMAIVSSQEVKKVVTLGKGVKMTDKEIAKWEARAELNKAIDNNEKISLFVDGEEFDNMSDYNKANNRKMWNLR